MEKKIIAIALVLVLMVTVFTACGKKYIIQEVDGVEYPLVTDENGRTVIDESNRLAFYVTDKNGELATNDLSETQTNWVQLKGDLATDEILNGDFYRLNVPEGWEADGGSGRLEKKGSNELCCITPVSLVDEMEKGKTYNDYLVSYEDVLKQAVEGMEKEGNQASYKKSTTAITLKGLACTKFVFDAYDKDGKPLIHSENLLFASGTTVYKMEYFSINGIGYDEDFNFEAYLNENFVFLK